MLFLLPLHKEQSMCFSMLMEMLECDDENMLP